MSLLPLADCARLLGIHPKTLRHWLKQDALTVHTHPTDARVKCLTSAQISHLADLHGRQIQQENCNGPIEPEAEQPHASPETDALVSEGVRSPLSLSHDETRLLSQLASLESKVTTLTEQVAQLALALLGMRDHSIDHRLSTLETVLQDSVGKPLVFSPQPMEETMLERGKRRLNPAEARMRSRLPPLIEYSAQGNYVIVSAQDGKVDVEVDEEEWFDWLATISSFRFIGQCGRFSACRLSEDGQQTRSWTARRFYHGYDFRHHLGVTDHLTIAHLEQVAAALQSRVDAL